MKSRPVVADIAIVFVSLGLTLFTFHLFWLLLIAGYFIGVVAQAPLEE